MTAVSINNTKNTKNEIPDFFPQWEPEDMNEGQSSQILTCIVDGMRSDRPPAIRGAAARALINSLDFTRSNFEVQQERDVIMQVSQSVRHSVSQCALFRSMLVCFAYQM